jgi:hypothetical protein
VNGSTNIQNVPFVECGNFDPGSILEEGPRANFSERLSAPIAIESILGASYQDYWWVDMSYCSDDIESKAAANYNIMRIANR